jgi:hypothetical protein
MLDDEWALWEEEDLSVDWRALLDGALPWFKFPKVSLEIDGDTFTEDLSNEEI